MTWVTFAFIYFDTPANRVKNGKRKLRKQTCWTNHKKEKITEGLHILTDTSSPPFGMSLQDCSLNNTLHLQCHAFDLFVGGITHSRQVRSCYGKIKTLVLHPLPPFIDIDGPHV